MSLRGRINSLVVGIVASLGVVVIVLSLGREVDSERQKLLYQTIAWSNSNLSAAIYSANAPEFENGISRYMWSPALAYSAVYDHSGRLVLANSRGGFEPNPALAFTTLRGDASRSSANLITLNGDLQPVSSGWFAGLFDKQRMIHVTAPVMSARDPRQDNPSIEEISSSDNADSRHVVGYVHAAARLRALIAEAVPEIALTALGALLATVLAGITSFFVSRQLTAPLTRLENLTSEIESKWLETTAHREGKDLFAGIASVLEMALKKLEIVEAKAAEDRKRLEAQLDERSSELQRRNDELANTMQEMSVSERQFRQMAYYDDLTSLPNKRLFHEQLELLLRLAQRNGEQLAIMFLDLDDFKRINDSMGHTAGDALLKQVAQRLVGCMRESDLVAHNTAGRDGAIDVARVGGDEFITVLNKLDRAESAGVVAQRIVDVLREPFTIQEQEITISISAGIALAPGDASNVVGLLQAADTAMYYAKAKGKSGFAYYQNHMEQPRLARLRLEDDLRTAVERGELMLHYQPQVNTVTGTVVGAEALLRWNHPEHGLVPPLKFIPVAEELNIINDLGQWTVREACRQMSEFIARKVRLPKISVNVSALQFNSEFIDYTRETLLQTGLNPACLQLELTEGVAVKDLAENLQALTELKNMGLKMSIDDFGTAYSPLRYLSRLPLDEIKIDRSFLNKAFESPTDANLVTAIIGIARNMKLGVVAEGVETPEQFQFMQNQGVHVVQGYLFSPAVSAAELEPLLAPWHFMELCAQFTTKST